MGSKRSHRNSGEIKQVQQLKQENSKLRRQIQKLRKELSKIDIDRYSYLKDLIESQDRQDVEFSKKQELEALQEKWICHKCEEDYLKLIIVPRLDGVWYFRRCKSCLHKTKLKRYTDDVEGLVDEAD